MALTVGILWGLHFLVMGIVIAVWPDYGKSWMALWADVYPLYQADGGLPDSLLGIAWGFVDGLIGGALVAWLCNRVRRG